MEERLKTDTSLAIGLKTVNSLQVGLHISPDNFRMVSDELASGYNRCILIGRAKRCQIGQDIVAHLLRPKGVDGSSHICLHFSCFQSSHTA